MRTRAKALTVAAAMVMTFAILPTFGAAAAEPLEDGSYDVVIGEVAYTVDVVDGAPAIEGAEGVEFTFAFDEETNRVLDEFDVTVDGVTYLVTVADDGTVAVTEGEGEEPTEDPEDDPTEDDDADEQDAGDEEKSDVDALTEGDDPEALDEDDEVDDNGHGAVVSTVARCAPRGREAREAGLPNHGFFVRAAAHGEAVEFEADGQSHSADLASQEGADALCALVDELLVTAGPASAAADGEGAGGNGKGRAGAPGQLKKNG